MFGWEFPPDLSGGLGTACLGLTQGLAGRNVKITFVLPRLPSGAQADHLTLVGANQVRVVIGRRRIKSFRERVHLLKVDSPLLPYLSGEEYRVLMDTVRREVVREEVQEEIDEVMPQVDNYGTNLMAEVTRYSIVAGALARNRAFDVIHCHDWMTFLAGMEAKKASGKPLVVHVHSLEYDRSGEHINEDIFKIEKAGMLAADVVIAVSFYTMERIVKRYGIPRRKIRVVHNAVTREAQRKQLKAPRKIKEKIVLFLGRITFQKGPDYFLEAARKVVDRVPNVRFVMAGSGDMFPRMVDRMAVLRMGEYFHFTGFLRGADLERMYAMSDVYVMPSVSEPFGITPLEAMARNVPVIISRQSGVAELLEHAIKVDFWDVDGLADAIIKVLTDRRFARQMVEGSSRQLNRIKWALAAEKVVSIYQELV